MTTHRITLLPGDGIGPEITAVARRLLDAVAARHGFTLAYDEQPIGAAAIDATGVPLPESTLEACRDSDAVLLAAIGDPRCDSLPRELRPESGLLALRAGLGLFANLRPVRIIPALIDASSLKREVIENVDLLVVRELIGGVYFGTPKGRIEAEAACGPSTPWPTSTTRSTASPGWASAWPRSARGDSARSTRPTCST